MHSKQRNVDNRVIIIDLLQTELVFIFHCLPKGIRNNKVLFVLLLLQFVWS